VIETRDIKNYIFVRGIGFIEAGETPNDAVERINRAEVAREIADKKTLKELQKKFPGQEITQCGSVWLIAPKK
jgi:hypothetical protein